MTGRHTVDSITSDALDALYDQLAEANEQLRLIDALRQQHHDAATAAVQRADRAGAALARVRDALNSAYRTMVHDSRDWTATKRDAWLYAILVGWTCEDDHAHDDLCMGDDPLTETARQHGWDDATVARLRSYRAAVAALSVDGSGQPVSTAETPVILPADHTTEN